MKKILKSINILVDFWLFWLYNVIKK